MPDVFLSYSREDQATARRFAEALAREGFSVWWDQALKPGETFDRTTERALKEARAVVVLWSKQSVESRWVRSEATQADRFGSLVPVMIEACDRPIMFELSHTADLTQWKGDAGDPAWRGFVAELRKFVQQRLAGASGAEGPAPPSPATVHAAPGGEGRQRIRWAVVALSGLGLLAIGSGAFWIFGRSGGEVRSDASAAAVSPATAPVTLAVLPFANLSTDPEQEFFSDGLTEEILNQLAQVRELSVTGRTSSFSFKGKNEDLRVIAEKLGVAHLLEGSVRRDGNTVRITAQLIDGDSGAHLWSRAYDRELKQIFAVQEEIARDVAQALRVRLDVGESSRALGGTTNVDAYERYLRAMEDLRRGLYPQSAHHLREAVALDPEFALAWFELYIQLQPLASQDPDNAAALMQEREGILARLEAMVAPGSILEPRLRASVAWSKRDWSAVLAEAADQVDRWPNARGANTFLWLLLFSVGRFEEALPFAQRAAQLDPLDASSAEFHARALRGVGRIEEANAEYERGRALNSAPNPLGALFYRITGLGLSEAEVQQGIKALMQGDNPVAAPLVRLGVDPDDIPATLAAMRRALDDPANQSEGPLGLIATLAGAFGDSGLTIQALRRSYVDLRSGFTPLVWEATVHPGLRSDPAFKALLRDLGIAQYWRESGKWPAACKPVGEEDFECR